MDTLRNQKSLHQGKNENSKNTKIMKSFDLDRLHRLLVNILNFCKLSVFSCVVFNKLTCQISIAYAFRKN